MSGGNPNENECLSNGERIERFSSSLAEESTFYHLVRHVASIFADGFPVTFGIMRGENPTRSFGYVRTACARRVALSETRASIWWYTPFKVSQLFEFNSIKVP